MAFVQYFYDEINRAYKNPGSVNVKRLCVEGNSSCVAVQNELDEMRDLGQKAMSDIISYKNVQAGPKNSLGQQEVGAFVTRIPYELNENGKLLKKVTGGSEIIYIESLAWDGSRWLIADRGRAERGSL